MMMIMMMRMIQYDRKTSENLMDTWTPLKS